MASGLAQMIHKLIKISDNCPELIGEIQKYALDDRGMIPKYNDHLIDCLRYFNGASHYNMHEIEQAVRIRRDHETIQERRFRGLSHEKDKYDGKDWMKSIYDIDFD